MKVLISHFSSKSNCYQYVFWKYQLNWCQETYEYKRIFLLLECKSSIYTVTISFIPVSYNSSFMFILSTLPVYKYVRTLT